MLNPGDPPDGLDEFAPAFALRLQDLLAGWGEPIVTATALPCFLDPASSDPAPLFQAIEKRIERSDIEAQMSAGTQLDKLANIVAMPGPILHQRQDQQLGTAFLQLAIKDW